MAPGARSKFGAPMFISEVFLKQMYCIAESTCDIVGAFWRPSRSFGARRISPPLAPLVTPLTVPPVEYLERSTQHSINYFHGSVSANNEKTTIMTNNAAINSTEAEIM